MIDELLNFLFLEPGHYEKDCGCWADWGPNHLKGNTCLKHKANAMLKEREKYSK